MSRNSVALILGLVLLVILWQYAPKWGAWVALALVLVLGFKAIKAVNSYTPAPQ